MAGTIPPSQRTAAFARLLPAAQPTRFTDWLSRITPGGPPTLHVAHFLLPHYPWLHTTSGRTYATPDSGPALAGYSDGKWDTEAGVELARRRHLLQVGYVDRLLGTLVARLKATHHWRDTVFVVTADHGVGLTVGAHLRELDDVNRDEILGVPLFVHAPGMKPGIDDRPAQNIDVVPTVAGLLGVHIPWKVDGWDLSRPASPRPMSHPVGVGSDLQPTLHVQTIDLGDHLARLLALARARAVPVTSADPDLSILRSGPHGALIGKPITDFAVTGDAGGKRWAREYPDDAAFEHVDVNGSVPAYVTGRLENARPDDAIVGVVNGRVAGVGVIVEPDAQRVAMVLDPSYFASGANDVRFFFYVDDHTLAPV